MIFAELPLAEAEGAMLAHSLLLGGTRIPKGRRVDAALLAAARAQGIEQLWVARLQPGDIPEDEAARQIGARLAGPGLVAHAPVHGRVNLHAAQGGLLSVAPEQIHAANLATEAVGLSTLPPLSPVAPGELVATVKIMPYALPAGALDAVCAPLAPLRISGWRQGLRATLLHTVQPGTSEKLLDKTSAVTADRLARLGVACQVAPGIGHQVPALATALAATDADLVLVAGATATADRADVVPAAITAAGGDVMRVGMPVDPGNLLVLARLGPRLVIGLPGCARSPRRNGLDLILERWAAGLDVGPHCIAEMGVGGLLDGGGRPVPWSWSG